MFFICTLHLHSSSMFFICTLHLCSSSVFFIFTLHLCSSSELFICVLHLCYLSVFFICALHLCKFTNLLAHETYGRHMCKSNTLIQARKANQVFLPNTKNRTDLQELQSGINKSSEIAVLYTLYDVI